MPPPRWGKGAEVEVRSEAGKGMRREEGQARQPVRQPCPQQGAEGIWMELGSFHLSTCPLSPPAVI